MKATHILKPFDVSSSTILACWSIFDIEPERPIIFTDLISLSADDVMAIRVWID